MACETISAWSMVCCGHWSESIGITMKPTKQITKTRNAKIESMKAIKAAYLKAKAEGSIKTYRVTRIS
jgi:hypothetical protein